MTDETTDFRSDKSESAEGKGIARRAWDSYAAAVNKHITPTVGPLIQPAVAPVARTMVADLIGFWVVWHLHGGFQGMLDLGYHRATIYRKINRFRKVFKVHPDEFTMDGITLDPDAYWAAADRKRAEHKAAETDATE